MCSRMTLLELGVWTDDPLWLLPTDPLCDSVLHLCIVLPPNSNSTVRHNNLSYFVSQFHNMFEFPLGFGNLFLNVAHTLLSDYDDKFFIEEICRMRHSVRLLMNLLANRQDASLFLTELSKKQLMC